MNAQEQRIADLHAQARADYLQAARDGVHARMAENARTMQQDFVPTTFLYLLLGGAPRLQATTRIV